MKVYYEAVDTDHEAHKYIRMRHTPDVGGLPGRLYVSDSPQGTNSFIEFRAALVVSVYEIDLPYDEADLAQYRSEFGGWRLPAHMLAEHPGKPIEYRVLDLTLGEPLAGEGL
jgi:hypothetical protein